MRISAVRLTCNGIGTLAWIAFFIQLAGNGHLTVDVTWEDYLVNALFVLGPLCLLALDFYKLNSGKLMQSTSSVLWMLFWAVAGVINVATTASIAGWVGGWDAGRWFGHIAAFLMLVNILTLIIAVFQSVLPSAKSPS